MQFESNELLRLTLPGTGNVHVEDSRTMYVNNKLSLSCNISPGRQSGSEFKQRIRTNLSYLTLFFAFFYMETIIIV